MKILYRGVFVEDFASPKMGGTVEADLRPLNLGPATAKQRTQDRSAWRLLVGGNDYKLVAGG